MRILVTNDDGIGAPGLAVAEEIAAALAGPDGEVWVVAPAFEQSGVAHCVSYVRPMRLERLGRAALRRRGLARRLRARRACGEILKDAPPDLVLSGVNRGHNVAEDTLYSGTVGGAMEAALHGCRAVALSQYFGPANRAAADAFAAARAHGAALARRLARPDVWPKAPYGVFYNVNFPPVPAEAVKGTRATFQGYRDQPTFGVLPHVAPNGRKYLWLTHGYSNAASPAGSDSARMPRRLDHRHPAQRRPHRARPHRAACAGARIGRGSVMPAAEQQMQFVFTLRSRGVTNADVLKAMEADPRGRTSSKASSSSAPSRTRRCRSPAARPSASRPWSG